jgi:hypothetical protein
MATLVVPPVRRVVSGMEELQAAREKELLEEHRQLWPYVHVYPPPNYKRVHQEASIAVSSLTPNTPAEVLAYTIPGNYRFMFNGLVQLYIGSSSFTPGDGNVKWDLDVDIPAGVTSPQGYPVQGFSNSGIPKGAYQSGIFAPYPLAPAPEEIGPLHVLRSKVTVTAQITTGRIIAVFDGWLLPVLGPR